MGEIQAPLLRGRIEAGASLPFTLTPTLSLDGRGRKDDSHHALI